MLVGKTPRQSITASQFDVYLGEAKYAAESRAEFYYKLDVINLIMVRAVFRRFPEFPQVHQDD